MAPSPLSERADRIANELLVTWQRHRTRTQTARFYHMKRALPIAARIRGWRGEVTLETWLSAGARSQREPQLDTVMDRITTDVLTAWMGCYRAGRHDKARALIRALPGIGYANALCEGLPLGRWALEKTRSSQLVERKAVAEALYRLVGPVHSYADLMPALKEQLRDRNRFIRAKAAGSLARIGSPVAGDPAAVAALIACLQEGERAEGRLTEALEEGPLFPGEFYTYAEDLQENSPDHFTWAMAAVALGRIGAASTPEVVAALQAGLESRVWLVRIIAAEVMVQLGIGNAAMIRVLDWLRTGDGQTQRRALHCLGSLSMRLPVTVDMLDSLGGVLQQGDPLVSAAVVETLGMMARANEGQRDRILEMLRGVLGSPMWILHLLVGRIIRQAELVAGRGAPAAQIMPPNRAAGQAAQFDPAGALERLLQSWSKRDLPRYRPAPLPADSQAPHADVHVLHVALVWNDRSSVGQAAHARKLDELATAIRSVPSYRSACGAVAFLACDSGFTLVFFTEAARAAMCAIELARAVRDRPLFSLRQGLHSGADLRLVRPPQGDWRVEGRLLTASEQVARSGRGAQILLSQTAASHLHRSNGWFACMERFGERTIQGHGAIALYSLRDPATIDNTTTVVRHHDLRPARARSGVRRLRTIVALVLCALLAGFLGGMLYFRRPFDAWIRETPRPQPATVPKRSRPHPVTASKRLRVTSRVSKPRPESVTQSPRIASLPATRSTDPLPQTEAPSEPEPPPTEHPEPSVTASKDGKPLPQRWIVPPRPTSDSEEQPEERTVEITIVAGDAEITGIDEYDSKNSQKTVGAYMTPLNIFGDWFVISVRYRTDDNPSERTKDFAFDVPANSPR